jgi:hypothetical protein
MTMGNCGDCRFWIGDLTSGRGECKRILAAPIPFSDDDQTMIMSASSDAWLQTRDTFGCVQYVPRPRTFVHNRDDLRSLVVVDEEYVDQDEKLRRSIHHHPAWVDANRPEKVDTGVALTLAHRELGSEKYQYEFSGWVTVSGLNKADNHMTNPMTNPDKNDKSETAFVDIPGWVTLFPPYLPPNRRTKTLSRMAFVRAQKRKIIPLWQWKLGVVRRARANPEKYLSDLS